MQKIDQYIIERAEKWLADNFDQDTREQVQTLLAEDPAGLADAFYRDLEFGTGGLRGIMGVGTNRMNKYTVGMATQGLANYLRKMFKQKREISIAIAYDSRRNNTFFANITADIMSANGIRVFLFDALRPTPELSFAIRYLNCQAGVVITASHNPPGYNGYKAYWEDGGQLVSPHDKNVIEEVNRIRSIEEVKFARNENLVTIIGDEIDRKYVENITSLTLSPETIQKHRRMKIVYTPIHGTGVKLVPVALRAFGFENIYNVPEQDVPDGNFPTVKSPNPEEPVALALAINRAKEVGADLVMATDPDADRVGIAVKNDKNEFVLLNGNETATLLIYYLLKAWKRAGKITGKEFIIKTVVTTEILKVMADMFGVKCFDTLTGFKYIAQKIRELEGTMKFIGGGEESYGYLVGDFVRDKDAVISCCMIAETAAWAMDNGKTLFELLPEIYLEFGFFREKLISVVKKGKQGAEEIQMMMDNFRNDPPKNINGSALVLIKDYLQQKETDLISGKVGKINLPRSNVLQFFLKDGSKISVRPSGTEPKIKFYIGVRDTLDRIEDFNHISNKLDQKIVQIIADMNLN
jgi:phosphoglucomutase